MRTTTAANAATTEERRRTIEKRFETPSPTGSERLAHKGQRLGHLCRGVGQRVEEEAH